LGGHQETVVDDKCGTELGRRAHWKIAGRPFRRRIGATEANVLRWTQVRGRRPAYGAQTGEGITGRRKIAGTHGHHQNHPGNNPVHNGVPQGRLPVRGGHAV